MAVVNDESFENDCIIDFLKISCIIWSKGIENAFRAVNREDNMQVGSINLLESCICGTAMEGLCLRPGLSFLNIGSGTGYLNTVAALILGENGTNHGIEINEELVTHAYEHLEEFKKKSLDVDTFEFCEPVFQLGNFLNVMPDRQYDRVYWGATSIKTRHKKFLQQFVKIGGILVMPYKNHMLSARRIGQKTWSTDMVLSWLPASVPPQDEADRCLLQLPLWKPRTLQELCRNSIRTHLRKIIWSENNNLVEKRPINLWPYLSELNAFVLNFRDTNYDSTDDEEFENFDANDKGNNNDSKNLENEKTDYLDTSSDDETRKNGKTTYRKDGRACRKRPSKKKCLSLGNNAAKSFGSKKSYESSISTGAEKSNKSDCSASTSVKNSMPAVSSESENESKFENHKPKDDRYFAHTIRKDLFKIYMKKKIDLLPLPRPLLFYVNYNRKL